MIVLSPIVPEKLDSTVFYQEAKSGMIVMGAGVKKDFQKTSRSWSGSKPVFSKKTTSSTGIIVMTVSISSGRGADKWFWLDRGTKVRYATMSRNFRAKTQVGNLSSGAGRGGLIFVNKKKPRPGIKARGWTVLIVRTWTPRFKRLMGTAMSAAAKKSAHYIR